MFKAPADSACFVTCMVTPSEAFCTRTPATAMKPVVALRPEVEAQGEFTRQELSQRYVGQGEVFRDLCHFGMSFAACCEELLCLVPRLVVTHPLTE